MSKTQKIFIIVLLLIVIAGGVWAYTFRGSDEVQSSGNTNTSSYATNSSTTTTNMNTNTQSGTSQADKLAASPVATVETSLGTVKIQFYTSEAPELTKNFIELAKSGYYNGLTFHRIIPGFVIQGGDPLGTGTGGHSYKGEGQGLADEAGALALKHTKGAVAWAKSSLPNSIGSQFYIALEPLASLDGGYSVFGQVVEGMDVIEKIGAVATDATDKPTTPVTMTTVTISE